MRCANLLIIDSQSMIREALRALLRDRIDIRIIGEACDYGGAMRATFEQTVDVALLFSTSSGSQRLDMIRGLKSIQPTVKIVVLTANYDLPEVAKAMAAGANGFLVPDCGFEEMMTAIKEVLAGKRYVTPTIANYLATPVIEEESCLPPDRASAATAWTSKEFTDASGKRT